MKKTNLQIDGMRCDGCIAGVQKALRRLPGVREIRVDLPTGRAVVEHEDGVTAGKVASAVSDAGYDAAVLSS